MNLRKRLKDMPGSVLAAMLLGCSLAYAMTGILGFTPGLLPIVLVSAGAALCCVVMCIGIWPLVILIGGAVLYCVLSVMLKLPGYVRIVHAAKQILTGGEGLQGYTVGAECLMSAVFTMLTFLFSRLQGGVYPAVTLTLLVAVAGWIAARPVDFLVWAPAILALAVLFAGASKERTNVMRALPVAAISVLTALLLMPLLGGVSDGLQQFGREVRDSVRDHLMFSEARTLYSIQTDGYQSVSGQLGGDANPSDFPIMEVETEDKLYLRGTIKREYTGKIWIDNRINSRNLFSSALRRSLRDETFGLTLPAAETDASGVLPETQATITYLSRGTNTLFTPHRLESLETGEDMTAYFSTPGEVFITRTVRKNDSYTFRAQIPDAYAPDMAALLTRLDSGTLPESMESYLQLPSTVSEDIYRLTYGVIRTAQTPYERALAIEGFLESQYAYTLTPGKVPENADFVSYFLLEGRQGYCTYFATAMGVMARIAGIPSRYVEGYLVEPEEDGSTLITGEDAHAWVELYFDGFGWLSFDATPEGLNGRGTGEPEQTPEPTIEPDPDATPIPMDVTPAPEVTPTPEPEDIPDEPTPEPTYEPTYIPEDSEPTMLPSSSPTEETRASDTGEQPKNNEKRLRLFLTALAILLLILAILLICLRVALSSPKTLAGKVRRGNVKLTIYYRAVLTVLEQQGMSPTGGETPLAFAARVRSSGAVSEGLGEAFSAFTDAIMASRYGKTSTTPEMIALAENAYKEAKASLRLRERIRWYRRRIFRGMGDTEQIP